MSSQQMQKKDTEISWLKMNEKKQILNIFCENPTKKRDKN